ncbi:hypothetical protein [Streptomyces acidicola]|uniref:hypothetical protein n=1 Tax=Streptomyces acidicola TaxID=2596892 RepID=UPI00341CF959
MAHLLGPRTSTAFLSTCPPHQDAEPPKRPPGLVINLPVEYTAFCLLYQDRYLRYARARLADPGLSRRLVETALGKVATNWASVLASHCPAAEAWTILGSVITAAAHRSTAAGAGSCNAVYRILSTLQADIVTLRHGLSLSEEQAADLMGVEEPVVACQLRMAHRNLPRELAHALSAAPGAET